ncbi:30S ribosome-binding factor [BD1-7 clade bacterium]|uniref:Ribosome-binding factor A n=1 Tax=BD1-7 clade bacterium TaxID=2029982 RepID=A0A5S9MVH7_9GAMM|nr:30S ribosome-binding factor [BD1-7 clade bacterium]
MAREFGRPQRVADFLRKELSQLIQQEIRDPRVGMVSLTDVEVSRDLTHARIYITILGCDDADSAKESVKVLNGAAGFLRSLIAKSTTMRTTPSLRFFFDESVIRGSHLSALIDKAVGSQEQISDSQADSSDDKD